jgi:hypothetical protein
MTVFGSFTLELRRDNGSANTPVSYMGDKILTNVNVNLLI